MKSPSPIHATAKIEQRLSIRHGHARCLTKAGRAHIRIFTKVEAHDVYALVHSEQVCRRYRQE